LCCYGRGGCLSDDLHTVRLQDLYVPSIGTLRIDAGDRDTQSLAWQQNILDETDSLISSKVEPLISIL
jgi:hypothetical protein